MERDTKKSRVLYDEILQNLFSADNARIKEILLRFDVEEALNLYIAVAFDPTFFKFIDMMNKNLIWFEWTKRDMEIICKPEWNSNTVLWFTEDKPNWKVYYLWLRYYVSCKQFLSIQNYPGYELKYLNVLQIPNIGIVNARKYIPNYSNVFKMDLPSPDDEEYFRNFVTRFTAFQFYNSKWLRYERTVDIRSTIETISFLRTIETVILKNEKLNIIPYVALKFPKTANPKKRQIVLASCIECNNTNSGTLWVEKTNPKRVFCDKICQKEFYNKF